MLSGKKIAFQQRRISSLKARIVELKRAFADQCALTNKFNTDLCNLKDAALAQQARFYESRIIDLQAQIEDLRKLVFPENTHPKAIPLVQVESNAILSGEDEMIQVDAQQEDEYDRVIAEREAILSGEYS